MGSPDTARYAAQHRGDDGAYARYLAGMDASMRQKVALTAAHLLAEGRVADMGAGSGAGSAALAALYPRLQVIGVDVSEEAVRRAQAAHGGPHNLSFVVGDAAAAAFAPASLDGVFDSSMLHHVTSFGGYDRGRAGAALAVQVAQLCEGGVLIVRDFVDPGPGEVLLDLPDDDGDATDDPRSCSSARLFVRFSREFRALAAPEARGFALREEAGAPPSWRRFRTTRALAAEFLLRKDYRADWALEVQEEYFYATQRELEDTFTGLGLRVLASTPIWNPWIVRHRLEGRYAWRDAASGAELEHPATNVLVVGERVARGRGVRFRTRPSEAAPGFLGLSFHRDLRSGHVLDLVRRPHDTLDVIPWFEDGGQLYVLARMSYPRPILAVDEGREPPLDGARAPHYVTEPLVIVRRDEPLAYAVEEALAARAGVEPQQIRRVERRSTYYPSPGGLAEEVRAIHVEIEPVFVDGPAAAVTDTSSGGRVGAIEARQLLRAAQVGGLPDARLELNTYALLDARGLDRGPWIGEELTLGEGAPPAAPVRLADALAGAPRRVFTRATAADSRGFLALSVVEVEELDAGGAVVARTRRELVTPRPVSRHTVACAVLRRAQGRVWLGLQDHDLPAAQLFEGSSRLWVCPAWRLPREVGAWRAMLAWVGARLRDELGVAARATWALGGRYHPSAGVTPEVVYPLAVEVEGDGRLTWVPLDEVRAEIERLTDGHLRVVALRAAHALGV